MILSVHKLVKGQVQARSLLFSVEAKIGYKNKKKYAPV